MSSLDPVIHAPARLQIMAALAQLPSGDSVTFPRLQKELEMTAGNLSTHVLKLDNAGYVDVTKTHERRSPVTYLSLSPTGRMALDDYTRHMRKILEMGPS
ncbi:transcriptional regulator [Nesterenkonia sp. CF4.4]|uniref:transcriptional regulator n=1 Tax=Nesterenkonia sp. CF4.4 TaxID=3373079 RepID=UPI003EE796E6